jgi:hypothetical protein
MASVSWARRDMGFSLFRWRRTYPESVGNSNPLKSRDKFWLTREARLPIFAQIRGFL